MIEKFNNKKKSGLKKVEELFGKDIVWGLILGIYNNLEKDLEQLEESKECSICESDYADIYKTNPVKWFTVQIVNAIFLLI